MQSGCCEAAVTSGPIVAVLISSAGQSGRRKAAISTSAAAAVKHRGRREAAAIANFGSNFSLELAATLSELLPFATAGQLPCRQPFTRRSAACHWYRGRSRARC